MTSQYPFNGESPRRFIAGEAGTVAEVRAALERLAGVAAKKRGTDVNGSPRESIDYDHYGAVMAERRKREAEQI